MSNVLECKNVVKTFHDGDRDLEILRGIDLAVPKGEILAISGSSGAGKSTLLHIMGTLDDPTSGDLVYNGKPISSMSKGQVNKLRNEEIGFVFQFYHLLPEFTALENVMMPALNQGVKMAACREKAEAGLEKVGLVDRMTHKPGKLSGGEQQRVAIARALFNEPSVVLADEPTGNLDEATGEGVIDLLWKLNESDNITLVIVTHDLDLARKANRWVHLHEGHAEQRTD
ncbi:MAG: ABC transporter ATP-binding protein [Candidatus Hydrogenedentota bacterium]